MLSISCWRVLDLRSQAIDFIFLIEDAAKGLLHGGRDLPLLGDERDLLLVEIGQNKFAALGMEFLDLEIPGLARRNGYAEAQIRSGCFLGFGTLGQFPVFPRGMLDDHIARRRVGIVQSVFAAVALLAGQIHQAFDNADAGDGSFARLLLHRDPQSGIGGIGDETALGGMNRLDQAFSGKGVAVEDVERSGVESQAAAVGDPKSTADFARVLVPDGDLLRIDARLQNRHQGGLILADRDLLLEVVFEIVAEVFGFGFGLLFGDGVEGGCSALVGATVYWPIADFPLESPTPPADTSATGRRPGAHLGRFTR